MRFAEKSLIDLDGITERLLEGTKNVVGDAADKFNIVDAVFALGHVAKTTSTLIEAVKENLSERLPDEMSDGLANAAIPELLMVFLSENRERLEVIGSAAPGIIELLLEHLVGKDSDFDLSDLVGEHGFEGILDSLVDQTLGMMNEGEAFDLPEFTKSFEGIIDVFIQEWLLPKFDRDLGI